MNNQPVYWKQRNGKLIDVDDMDINHLRNTLKMIIKNSQKVQKTSPSNIEQAFDNEAIEEQYNEEMNYLFNDDEARGNQWN
jgi:hypothetical protein